MVSPCWAFQCQKECKDSLAQTITLANTTGFANSTIKEKASGEIILSGWSEPNNSNGYKPFLIMLDHDGFVLSSKIVNAGNSYVSDVIPEDDGFIFAGGINGFGKLFEKGDPLILKTDKNLEY